jgi:succinate dehydrogenase flavin-adding protein (antitoxin of CptAB toxin-antitoxin module)
MQSKSAFHLYFLLSILFFSCFPEVVCAQGNSICTYRNLDSYKVSLAHAKNVTENQLDKKIRKDYDKIIEEKDADLVKRLSQKGFLFDTVVYPYLNRVFNQILEENSLDKNQFHFFIDRSSDVNAYSYEDGTIVCNLGLVTTMENESQLAMALCHELGHYLLNHVNNSIIKHLEKYNSPEFLAQIKEIKKQGYDTKDKLEALLMKDAFDRRYHSRDQERAADSLGIVLYRNTGYDGKNISHMFDLLGTADKIVAVSTIQNFFKQESININEDLLKPPKRMSFGVATKKEIADSLKTHPDCSQRKMAMQFCFNKNPKHGANYLIGNEQRLSAIKKIALFDEATYSKDSNELGFYFYQLIQNDLLFPSDGYVKSEIFDTMVSICSHQKSHTLYAIVSNQYISKNDNDEYNKLLKLLDNLSLNEMTQIATSYYQNNKSLITASAEAVNKLNKLKN